MQPIRRVVQVRTTPRFGGAAPSDDGGNESSVGEPQTHAVAPFRSNTRAAAVEEGDEDLALVHARAAAALAASSMSAATARGEEGLGFGDFISFGGAAGSKNGTGGPSAFDSDNDSVASSERDVPTAYDKMKRNRRLNRHFDGFDAPPRVTKDDDDDGDDISDDDLDDDDAIETGSSRGSSPARSGAVPPRKAAAASVSAPPREELRLQKLELFKGSVLEGRAAADGSGEAHLTLMSVTRAVTIQGPCVVVGLTGEVVVGGCYIGRGCVTLPTRSDRCAVHPTSRLDAKGRACETMDGAAMEHFGRIHWPWIEARLEEWRVRHAGSMPPMVVVAYSGKLAASAKSQEAHRNQQKGKAVRPPLPPFFSKFAVPSVDPALLPSIIPCVLKSRDATVAVVGSQNIGKSTLCRFVANAFVSLRGECLWLDFDLGQPEFGVAGCITLSRLKQPLFGGSGASTVETLRTYFLGSSRVRCPVLTARSIAAATADALALRGGSPLVVNTHGWIYSTGRRATVEALRRLRLGHIIHLLLPQSRCHGAETEAASPWLTVEMLRDSTAGINATVVPRRFVPAGTAAAASALPEVDASELSLPSKRRKGDESASSAASAADAPCEPTIHRVVVERDLVPKGASESRRGAWARYFGAARGSHVSNVKLHRLAIDLRKVHIAVFSDGATPHDVTGVCCALAGTVVALVVDPTGTGMSPRAGRVAGSEEWKPKPVAGFAIVASSEGEIAASYTVMAYTPIHLGPNATVTEVLVATDRADTEWLSDLALIPFHHRE